MPLSDNGGGGGLASKPEDCNGTSGGACGGGAGGYEGEFVRR